ncbi:MAG: 23S rRNA (guanosine(2251)-2'-O)-methyltransferase RlmB [Verrucomicrobiota bacterium]
MKRSSRANPKSGRRHTHSGGEGGLPSRPEEDLLGIVESAETPFILILDQVQDPHNLGACLRSANAAGVDAVIAPKNNSVGITDVVQRVACGAAEVTPFVQVTNLARTMKQLQEAGVWLAGTSDQATQSLYETDLKGPIGLVLGAEGKGIRRLTAENCDFLVQIPMLGTVECLNVSVATGVCLFEAVRQRNHPIKNQKS